MKDFDLKHWWKLSQKYLLLALTKVSFFDDFASFVKIWPIEMAVWFQRKNRIVECWLWLLSGNMPPWGNVGSKIYLWKQYKYWAKKASLLSVEGASSVRNNQNELMLKIFVLTFGGYLQFSTSHKFVSFPDRYQLSKSSVQKSAPVKNYVSRAVEKLCARVSSTFIAQASNWIRWSRFLNFQLELCADALMLAEQCWETSMAQSGSSVWHILWGYSGRVWYMCLSKI